MFVTCTLENGDVNFCQWFCNTDDFVSPVDLRKGCFQFSNFVCTKFALSWRTSRSFQCAFTCSSIKNSRKIRSYTYNVAVLPGHVMQMRLTLRRVVCRCPDAARGVKCSGDRGKGGHEPSSSAESRKWRHLLLWTRKVVWKLVNISGNREIAAGNAICRWDVITKSVYIVKFKGPSCFSDCFWFLYTVSEPCRP